MKILIAKDAGYCFGVRDAVNLAYDTAHEKGDVYMLGTIVHNERVIENLDKAGAKVVDEIDQVPDGKTLLFRAHGTAPELWKEAKKKNIKSIVLTGKSGGRIANMGDCIIKVPSNDTQRIQEAHLMIEHILCEIVESALVE